MPDIEDLTDENLQILQSLEGTPEAAEEPQEKEPTRKRLRQRKKKRRRKEGRKREKKKKRKSRRRRNRKRNVRKRKTAKRTGSDTATSQGSGYTDLYHGSIILCTGHDRYQSAWIF